MQVEIVKMRTQIDDVTELADKNKGWYSETNLKLHKALNKIEPLHMRMQNLEVFAQRTSPFLTHL